MENNTQNFVILFDKSPEVEFLDSLRSFLSDNADNFVIDGNRVSGYMRINDYLKSQSLDIDELDISGPIGNIFYLIGYMNQILSMELIIPTDSKYNHILSGFKILYYLKFNKHLRFYIKK